MISKKCWKIRDISDPEYAKLGDSPDARRNRADIIESDRKTTCLSVTAIILSVISIVFC